MPVSVYGLRGSDGILWPVGRTSFGTRSIDRAQTNLRAANLPVFNLVEQEIVSARGRFKGTSNAGRVLTCRTSRRPLRRFAPRSTLPHQLFDRLRRHEIYIAAYVITDRAILQALTRAADRGVKVRIYLDGAQLPSASRQSPSMTSPRRPSSRCAPNATTPRRCTSRASKSTGDCCALAPRTFPRPD
ncbi:MAG: phospholipase D-like domain-containing protein [Methylocella sp.]